MSAAPRLSLAEWIVLALVDEQPRHGFAVAALTAADGELGRVWTVAKPVVYRASTRLQDLELVRAEAGESGNRGPQRSVLHATPRGRRAARAWLQRPVEHLRDTRSEFLVKLALLDRRGADRTPLVEAQRAVFAPVAGALAARTSDQDGFARVLGTWRAENAGAIVRFLEGL